MCQQIEFPSQLTPHHDKSLNLREFKNIYTGEPSKIFPFEFGETIAFGVPLNRSSDYAMHVSNKVPVSRPRTTIRV